MQSGLQPFVKYLYHARFAASVTLLTNIISNEIMGALPGAMCTPTSDLHY
jgi:hypothetical protein